MAPPTPSPDDAGDAAIPESAVTDDVVSFGTFKPVGHALIAIDADRAGALVSALADAGFRTGLLWISARETEAELQALIDGASPLAGFGYEITMMRHYLKLSREGYRWLLVPAADADAGTRLGEVARRCGAALATRYGRVVVEELL